MDKPFLVIGSTRMVGGAPVNEGMEFPILWRSKVCGRDVVHVGVVWEGQSRALAIYLSPKDKIEFRDD